MYGGEVVEILHTSQEHHKLSYVYERLSNETAPLIHLRQVNAMPTHGSEGAHTVARTSLDDLWEKHPAPPLLTERFEASREQGCHGAYPSAPLVRAHP